MYIWLIGLFAILWGLVIYHHLGYPIIMRWITNKERKPKEIATEDGNYRSIAILIPAYNEAEFIADKIRNVASLAYPADKLKLYIACDGCKDNTAQIARLTAKEWQNDDLNIMVIEFKKNHGKVAILNKIIPDIDADIIALSDASALISNDALKIANAHFSDQEIGVVAATYQIFKHGCEGERKYWEYQRRIKRGESIIGSPIGVHGALYFFRKNLFKAMPADTINDDFILPMQIVCDGYKSIYDCKLVALELEIASLHVDQKRRVRIASGNFQQFIRMLSLGSPKFRGTAFSFLSGKALRSLMPLILLFQLVICIWLGLHSAVFFTLSVIQITALFAARLSLLVPDQVFPNILIFKPIKIIFYLLNGYWSSFIGTFRYIFGLDRSPWKSVKAHHE